MKNRRSTLPRGTEGFTLVEILVVMAIIAGLAAVTLPAITQQLRKSDVNRVAQDLKNLATSAQSFQADVRSLPATLEQMETPIKTEDKDLFVVAYSKTDSAAWAGPYVEKGIPSTGLTTGFGATISPTLTLQGTSPDPQYLRFTVTGLSEADAKSVDKVLDDGNVGTGRLQYASSTLTYDAIIGTN